MENGSKPKLTHSPLPITKIAQGASKGGDGKQTDLPAMRMLSNTWLMGSVSAEGCSLRRKAAGKLALAVLCSKHILRIQLPSRQGAKTWNTFKDGYEFEWGEMGE